MPDTNFGESHHQQAMRDYRTAAVNDIDAINQNPPRLLDTYLPTLRDMVGQLDIIRDYLASHANPQQHRDLVECFRSIATARESLVDAHNLYRDVVDPRPGNAYRGPQR